MSRYIRSVVAAALAIGVIWGCDTAQAHESDASDQSGSAEDLRAWNIGIFGTYIPFKETTPIFHPGVSGGISSTVGAYDISADLRFTWPIDYDYPPSYYSSQTPDVEGVSQYNLIMVSLTARRAFTPIKDNTAPILGYGVSVIGIYGRNNYAGDTRSGFGVHGIAGLEMFRNTKSRVRLEARVDVPFYIFKYDRYRYDFSRYSREAYIAPVSLALTYYR